MTAVLSMTFCPLIKEKSMICRVSDSIILNQIGTTGKLLTKTIYRNSNNRDIITNVTATLTDFLSHETTQIQF